jgi:hypothetical protein
MTEPEVFFPVRCPICTQESLAGFRISVIADAFETGQIRLYANCHVVAWDASNKELKTIVEYLDASWAADRQKYCSEMPGLDEQQSSCAFIIAGDLEEFAAEDSPDEFVEHSFADACRGTLQSVSSTR